MDGIDFNKIRNINNSQQEGFEELVCQLAHLSPPNNADFFIRKDGSGGDAGVECYWTLKNGEEHAWQAKYFINTFSDAQWKQIDKSVKAALAKHSKLTKYYICLPRDWSDSRRKIKDKPIKSSLDKWHSHVKNWESLAKSKKMNVKFTYWCKHEMISLLTSEVPGFSGRILYWFDEPILSHGSLCRIANTAKAALGERFSEEHHLELSISKIFEGIGQTEKWREFLQSKKTDLYEAKNSFAGLSGKLKPANGSWHNLYSNFQEIYEIFSKIIENGVFLKKIEEIKPLLSNLNKQVNICINDLYEKIEKNSKDDEEYNSLIYELNEIKSKLSSLKLFLFSKDVQAAERKAMVVLGEAGIGKSHLLCDLALRRLEKSLPTIFILGQHYGGGNPIDFIKKSLDLAKFSQKQVLEALDAAGESCSSRTLIIIDAINEGLFNEQWHNHLSSMISEISNFKNIAIIFSCRSAYENHLIPEDLRSDKLIRVEHHGFRGSERRAAEKYLSKQGISIPNFPILSPEFSNPLFLKTFCRALRLGNYNSFPKGLDGITKLFDFYIKSVSKVINRKKKFLDNEAVVQKALDSFADHLYPDKLHGTPISNARDIINKHDTKKNHGEDLFNLLIDEGVLSLDLAPCLENKEEKTELVRFTYERFSDHFFATRLVEKYSKNGGIENLFSEFIGPLISRNKIYESGGIIQALGIIIPEKFEVEFMDFIDKSNDFYIYFFKYTFIDALIWRSHNSFTVRTLELLNSIKPSFYIDKRIEILLTFSTEPTHPWNADFLDKLLKDKNMADRDFFWSINIALEDQEEEESEEREDQEKSTLRIIIDWALSTDLKNTDPERLRLTAKILTWMTTTSNRKIRDRSSKSLAKVFSANPDLIINMINNFKDIDDIYLLERLYAASYGAITHIDDKEKITAVSEHVFKTVFRNKELSPNLLLRDYARGILEYAKYKNALPKNIEVDSFRPPYKSNWPLEYPKGQELKKLHNNISNTLVKSSVMTEDFGIYTMSCVHRWSPTLLSEKQPETALELRYQFAKNLPEDLKADYLNYLKKIEKESSREGLHPIDNETIESLMSDLSSTDTEHIKALVKEKIQKEFLKIEALWNKLKLRIEKDLSSSKNEEFRWVSGMRADKKPAALSRKLVQRWVCKKVFDLGWKKELFNEFEKNYCKSGRGSRKRIERVGKKYQWIAFREALARISDNLHWIDYSYNDADNSSFEGPWQANEREIDPTLLIRKTYSHAWKSWDKTFWWRPFIFKFAPLEIKAQKKWLWDKKAIPPFKSLIKVTSNDKHEWLVLHGFSYWKKEIEDNFQIAAGIQRAWFQINSIIIKNDDTEKIKQKIANKETLSDSNITQLYSTGNQVYYREFPWHPSCNDIVDWTNVNESQFGVKYLNAVSMYKWGKMESR